MGNPEHIELVLQGPDGVAEWLAQNPENQLDLTQADFSGKSLDGANLRRMDLRGTNFSGASLKEADFRLSDMGGAHLNGVDLRGGQLSGANLAVTRITGANLSGAVLQAVNLRDADLSWSNMREANLSGADLSGVSLSGTILTEADLTRTNLRRARLDGADLTKSKLSGAILTGANLAGADLLDADLHRANLRAANFRTADLSGVNFSEALCAQTTFVECDFSGCFGLETAEHRLPSNVDLDTLVRTFRGTGYQTFAREQYMFFWRAGVPPVILDDVPKMIRENALQFYRCYITYGPGDAKFAAQLLKDLTAYGVRCWMYEEATVVGRGVWDTIDRAMAVYDKLIVICSRNSLDRETVQREVERSLKKEDELARQGATDADIVFPISLDDYVYDEWKHPRQADLAAKVNRDFPRRMRYEQELKRIVEALNPSKQAAEAVL